MREENGRPGRSKIRQGHLQVSGFAEVIVEFRGRNLSTLIAANPPLVPQDFLKVVPGNGTGGMQGLNARLKVEINQDFTEVK